MNKVPYALAVDSLIYVMICTKSNITHAVDVISRFLFNSRNEYWATIKWILRYLGGISILFLYITIKKLVLVSYTNMTDDIDSWKSIFDFLLSFLRE